MAPCAKLWEISNTFFLQNSARMGLVSLKSLALAGDGTPVYTSAQERKTRTCNWPYYDYCKANNITPFIDLNWKCGRPPVYKDDSP